MINIFTKKLKNQTIVPFTFLLFLLCVSPVITEETNEVSRYRPIISAKDSSKSIDELKKGIKQILSNNSLKKTSIGIAIYSLDTKTLYYQKNIDKYLTPASTTKLVTSFSAYNLLGPNYMIKTSIYSDGQDIISGKLNGNLYIVGHGDALFSMDDLDELAKEVYDYGIREITGKIYADGSFFDDITSRKKYSGDKDVVQPTPPITALSLEKNLITVNIKAGRSRGDDLEVSVYPESDGVRVLVYGVVGENPTVDPRPGHEFNDFGEAGFWESNQGLQLYGDVHPELISRRKKKPSKKLKVDHSLDKNGIHQIKISGTLPRKTTKTYQYYPKNPNTFVAGAFRRRLTALGIKVQGFIEEKQLPNSPEQNYPSLKSPKIITEYKRPAYEIVTYLNKNSDNYLAETVFKIIGSNYNFHKENSKDSRYVTKKLLDSLEIPCTKCKLNDGSGLSRRNLLSAESILGLLVYASESGFSNEYERSLSIAGIDGTLKNRMLGSLAESNLRAKTGTLRNVSALAGYVYTLDGEKLAFAFLFNGNNIGGYKRAENQLGELLAQFFYFNSIE